MLSDLRMNDVVAIFIVHDVLAGITYELDRVAGRYTRLEDEQSKPRTVFHLSQEKRINLFRLRQKYALLRPLLDAEYGSGTFIAADKEGEFEIRVSTSGLLIRPYK